ncbi:hypothetical protein F5X99DRAFT_412670 [Biscogniauxia marginata]|nr:hypothetical protein F5X99DRAFT_412670 [Biscogniauxia marginata]
MEPYFYKKGMPSISDDTDIITIELPTGEEYTAHAHLLVHYSKYFRNALRSGMKEASTRRFKLDEPATSDTLSFFIKWLYSRNWNAKDGDNWVDSDCPPLLFTKVWLFADYIQASELQNNVVALLCANYEYYPEDLSLRLEEFTSLPIRPNSGLYRLMTKEIARGISDSSITKENRVACLQKLDTDAITSVTLHLAEHNAVLDRAELEDDSDKNLANAAISHVYWWPPVEEFFEKDEEPTRKAWHTHA